MNLDPDDLQVYVSVVVTAVIWAALSGSAWLSLRGSRRSPETRRLGRFLLACLPLLLGLICLKAEIRWSGEDDWFTLDLSWFFLLPVALSVMALVTWFRARRTLRPAA